MMKRWVRRSIMILLCYAFLWSFVLAFLLVYVRSYNRLSHEPVTMAHMTIQPDSAALSLANEELVWEYPAISDQAYVILGTFPGAEMDMTFAIWQLLWEQDE